MESMEQVFDQCQQHEVKRLTFLKEALLDIKRHLNLTENQRLARLHSRTFVCLFFINLSFQKLLLYSLHGGDLFRFDIQGP